MVTTRYNMVVTMLQVIISVFYFLVILRDMHYFLIKKNKSFSRLIHFYSSLTYYTCYKRSYILQQNKKLKYRRDPIVLMQFLSPQYYFYKHNETHVFL